MCIEVAAQLSYPGLAIHAYYQVEASIPDVSNDLDWGFHMLTKHPRG